MYKRILFFSYLEIFLVLGIYWFGIKQGQSHQPHLLLSYASFPISMPIQPTFYNSAHNKNGLLMWCVHNTDSVCLNHHHHTMWHHQIRLNRQIYRFSQIDFYFILKHIYTLCRSIFDSNLYQYWYSMENIVICYLFVTMHSQNASMHAKNSFNWYTEKACFNFKWSIWFVHFIKYWSFSWWLFWAVQNQKEHAIRLTSLF